MNIELIVNLVEKADRDFQLALVPADIVEKFARLIVQECANILDKEQWDKGEDWVCADGTRIIPKIKEHFGVEE